MMKKNSIKKLSLFVIVSLIFLGLITWISAKTFSQQSRVKVDNRLNSIKVVSVDEFVQKNNVSFFGIRIRNISNLPIKSVDIKIDDIKSEQGYLNLASISAFNTDWVLNPGQDVEISFSAATVGQVVVKFVSVIFDDDNSEGEEFFVKKAKNKKKGMKLAFQMLLPLLKNYENKSDNISQADIETLKNQIKQTDHSNIPLELKEGFLDGMNNIKVFLNSLSEDKSDLGKSENFDINKQFKKNLAIFERAASRN